MSVGGVAVLACCTGTWPLTLKRQPLSCQARCALLPDRPGVNQFSSIPDPDTLFSETFSSMSLLASGRDGVPLQGEANQYPTVAAVPLPLFRYMLWPDPELETTWLPTTLLSLPEAMIP